MHPFLGAGVPSIQVQASDTTTITTVTTTSSATAYNNITPVELIASTAYDASSLMIQLRTTNVVAATRTSGVFEVMIGAGGSETTLIGPVTFGYYNNQSYWTLPIFIPAGSRLSIRVRTARTSTPLTWAYFIGYGGHNRDGVGLPQRWIAYGMVDDTSANAQGTIVTPGNAVWGSWTSLTTSTTYAHDLWLPMLDGGSQTVHSAVVARTRWAIASTTDAATMATNATVWHGPWSSASTGESFGMGIQGSTSPWAIGGFGGLNGIFYCPAAAGSAVSVSARANGAPSANSHGCSILAAL